MPPVTATFSEEDYSRLLMLSYLGEWMMNAIRKDPDPDYESVVAKAYSFAHGTGLEPLVNFNSLEGEWRASKSLDKDAQAFIDQYDEKTFWEELTMRLTERDLIVRNGERAYRGMRPDQRERAASSVAKGYTREFEDQGIDRLFISEEEPDRHPK
jgi:hypothetical protein